MKRILFLFFLSILIASCGDRAPADSVVTGPADASAALALSTTASSLFFGPLEFRVRSPEGDIRPDVEMKFFTGGTAFLSDLDRNLLSDTFKLVTTTDDQGNVLTSVIIAVPGCTVGSTTAVATSGTLLATVGSASTLWTATITRNCGATSGS